MTPDPTSPPPAGGELLTLDVDAQGIAHLWIERTRRPPVLSPALLAALDDRLRRVEELAGESRAALLVLRSRAPGVFLGGFDLASLEAIGAAREGVALAMEAQRVLRRLEQLPIPTVALIEGGCLGAGLEVALACSHRLASDTPRARLGLPEVRLGLIPGFGGTVRLPRLIGLQAALELIVSGRMVDAAEAARAGLVDELLPARHVEARLERFAADRLAGGRAATGARRRIPRRLLEETAPGRRMIVRQARRRAGESGLPGATHALEMVAEGVTLPLERAFRREAEMFGQLVAAAPARALLHVQRLAQEAGRGPLPEAPVRTAGVLGAGESGSAFAYLLARADLPVRVKDRKRTAVTAARQAVEAHLRHDAEHGRLPRAEAGRRAARVDGAHGFGGFGTLDLLVAAVGDRPAMVLRALRDAEEHTGERCVLAAASPLVQVGEVQAALAHPERVVGLHLFEPIDTLPLLEIAAGPATDAETLARCRELARRMGRVPVQVADRPGFLAPRLLAAYFAEAVRLLDEGASVQQVDRALEAFGFAMGPFRRMDAVGAARALRLMERLGEALGEHLLPAPVVRRLGEGEGFYRYRRGEPAGPNPRLPSGLSGLGAEHEELIRSRLLALLLNEAARAVEEGVADADAADLAAVHGLGFPRAYGGPLFHAAREEPGALRERLLTLERRFGTRFAPAPMVHRLLDGGERGSAVDSPTGHGQPGVL